MKTKIDFQKLDHLDMVVESVTLSKEDEKAFSDFLKNKKNKSLANMRAGVHVH